MRRPSHSDIHTPQEEGYVVEAVLEDLLYSRIGKNSTNNLPSLKFSCTILPIVSVLSSAVKKRDNDTNSWVRGEPDTGNLVSTCLNVNRKDFALADISSLEFIYILQGWLNPDLTLGSSDFCILCLPLGFDQIYNRRWP